MHRVYLLSCVDRKASTPEPARRLYRSDWFIKARNYVDAHGAPWYVLSALHGLVHPDTVLAPYDCALARIPRALRLQWGLRVAAQLDAELRGVECTLVFLAGRTYRDALAGHLACPVEAPLSSLAIGQQKAWLIANTPTPKAQE